MITLRSSKDRGHANHGWLDSYHSFSFADYYDPKNMGFHDLRVINEDRVNSGAGFPTHPHRDMEIITYVIEGALQHKDSMGNTTVIKPGEVQRMSAGTGILHSEFNPDEKNATHLLQIWILPNREGIKPSYDQKSFLTDFEKSNFILVASKDGTKGSVSLNQDVNMYVGKFAKAETFEFETTTKRNSWIQIVRGQITVNGKKATAGDGLAIENESELKIAAEKNTEFIVFDLP